MRKEAAEQLGLLPGGPGAVPEGVVQGDAVEWLKSLPDESVDLLVTDPAYESLEKHRARGTTTRLKKSKGSSNEWFPIFPNGRFEEFFREAYRVMRRNTHVYVLVDQETMFVAKPLGEAAGFKFWKPVVWYKTAGLGMGYHYRGDAEYVLFFEKGRRRLDDTAMSDVRPHPRVRGKYPTQKPVGLLLDLVAQSSAPGELVVDPFVGSGTAGVAAAQLGRRFAGADIQASAVELARSRIEAARRGDST